jgi:hypothetical protein
MDVFTKVLEPLVVVFILETTHPIANIDDENSQMERQYKKVLDYE